MPVCRADFCCWGKGELGTVIGRGLCYRCSLCIAHTPLRFHGRDLCSVGSGSSSRTDKIPEHSAEDSGGPVSCSVAPRHACADR